jgi:hypothetical protein
MRPKPQNKNFNVQTLFDEDLTFSSHHTQHITSHHTTSGVEWWCDVVVCCGLE